MPYQSPILTDNGDLTEFLSDYHGSGLFSTRLNLDSLSGDFAILSCADCHENTDTNSELEDFMDK